MSICFKFVLFVLCCDCVCLYNIIYKYTGTEFQEKEREAWDFLWDYMSICMKQVLEEVGSTLTVVRDSWEGLMNTYTSEDVGRFL